MDSYELLFHVKSQGEAALDAIEVKLRGVDTAGKTNPTTGRGSCFSSGRSVFTGGAASGAGLFLP